MMRQAMESAGLELFAEIGLILFCAAFILVVIRLMLLPKERAESLAQIPFSTDEVQ